MSFTQDSFLQQTQYADISTKTRWSKIVFQESGAFFDVYLVQKTTLYAIQSFQEVIRRMEDGSVMDFHDAPDMSFELTDQFLCAVMESSAQNRFDFGTHLGND